MIVTVSLSTQEVEQAVLRLRAKFPAATRRALKRTGTAARAEMAKLISADTGLPSKAVKDEINTRPLSDSAIQIETRGFRIPLIKFNARGDESIRGQSRKGRRAGVTTRLKSGKNHYPHAFIATMPSGHRGVYTRKTNAHTEKGPKGRTALPIQELHGPSMAHIFEKYVPIGADRAREALVKNLRAELAFALKK